MASKINWEAFKLQSLREGYHESEIGTLPGAREAVEADRKADFEETKSRTDWTTGVPESFASYDEMIMAMKDPAYKINPAYQAKVLDMIAKTPESIIKTPVNDPLLQRVEPDSILKAARRDAAAAKYKQLSVESLHDPIKRLELMELLHSDDPAVKEWLREGQTAINPEGPLNLAMRERGHGTHGPDLNAAMSRNESDIAKDNAPLGVDLGPAAGKK